MSTLASRPQLVSSLHDFLSALHFNLHETGHLIYKCGGIDKRTIEKFEKASLSSHCPSQSNLDLGVLSEAGGFAIAQNLIFAKTAQHFHHYLTAFTVYFIADITIGSR